MKRKFKPYLDIKDKKHLQLLLNRQLTIEENNFQEVEIDDFTEDSFRMLADRFKKFYGYEPAKEYKEYIDDIIYFLLVNKYYIRLAEKISAGIDRVSGNTVSSPESETSKLAFEDDPTKPHVIVNMIGDEVANIEDKNNILTEEQISKYKQFVEENARNTFLWLSNNFIDMLTFLVKNIGDIDAFIVRHYGNGFYSLLEACDNPFDGVDMNDPAHAKVFIDKLQMVLSKVQTVLFLLGTNVKQLRFHMIISILTSRRLEISVKSILSKADDIYGLFKKLKNTLRLKDS